MRHNKGKQRAVSLHQFFIVVVLACTENVGQIEDFLPPIKWGRGGQSAQVTTCFKLGVRLSTDKLLAHSQFYQFYGVK